MAALENNKLTSYTEKSESPKLHISMAEQRIPKFGGSIPSQRLGPTSGTSSTPLQRPRRRPPTLQLSKPEKADTTSDSISKSKNPNCGICLRTLPPNDLLCEKCQIWNDATHAFQCLKEVVQYEQRDISILGDMTRRKSCMMCQQISNAILERFQTSDQSIREELLKTEVGTCGPYALGEKALYSVDQSYFEIGGQRKIDPDDLRLSPSSEVHKSSPLDKTKSELRIVLYLLVTAPPKSNLRQLMPELDGYSAGAIGPNTKPNAVKFDRGIHRSVPEGGPGLFQPTIGLQLTLKYSQPLAGLCTVQRWENPYLDISLLKDWMNVCTNKHGSLCQVDDPKMGLPKGFRAIDTLRQCIVDLPCNPTPSFAALSYTWGPPSGPKELQLERGNLAELQRDGALSNHTGIPDLILDAIKLCQDLGTQYFWVDRLCIVQDDMASKFDQIQAMDRIYSLADFTIVAAVPNIPGLGLPGVRGRPRKSSLWNHTRRFNNKSRMIADNLKMTVTSSFWNTRGWTFQERVLSRKCIYITEFQFYFLCRKESEQEDIGDFAAILNPFKYNLAQYLSSIPDYTSRNLSYSSDILNAFAGIGNIFAKELQTKLLYGLPERYLAQALLWENSARIEKREGVPDIPSWSWAAWSGQIQYNRNSQVDTVEIGTLVRLYFQDPKNGLRAIETDDYWFFKLIDLKILKDLPSIDEEYPEMRFMPQAAASNVIWRECPHNPWEILNHPLNKSSLAIASKHPGSLLFTTTVAFLSLKARNSAEDEKSVPSVILELYNDSQEKVGQIAKMDSNWVNKKVNLNQKHEVVVIAAAILSEPSRYAQHRSILHVSGQIREPDRDASPWNLHVMLIERDHSNQIARRLGIGYVETCCWKQCNPTWSTIVLV